jgi:hypothetical protein
MSHQRQLTDSTSNGDETHDSLIRRSWHAMSDIFQPFSRSALDQLPKSRRPQRYTRADEIPDVAATDEDGQMPTVRDYHSITVPPQVRVPKKIPTPVRVESKVWFANERSTCLPRFLSVALHLSPVVRRCSIGTLGCSPCGFSVGLVPRHVYLDRHPSNGALQRFQRLNRAQLCTRLRSHQRWNLGACLRLLRESASLLTFRSRSRRSTGMPCTNIVSP